MVYVHHVSVIGLQNSTTRIHRVTDDQ